ncbi:MAG: hypothetical protein Q9213_003008 [Squamulea squamosa]
MAQQPPRKDQVSTPNRARNPTSMVDPPPLSTVDHLPRPPLSSTYSFYVHKPSFIAGELIVYNSIDKALAYIVATLSRRPFSKSPNVYIYRDPQKPTSLARFSTNPVDNALEPNKLPFATARLGNFSSTIPLAVDQQSIELRRRTLGFYKFAVEWESSQGHMRWHHRKLCIDMQLMDDKGAVLGGFDSKSGAEGRIGRLWVKDVEEEEDKQWVNEAVSVALTILMGLVSRG